MAAGLQVLDKSGNVKVDWTTRITKIIGTKAFTGKGEIDLSTYEGNDPWFGMTEVPVMDWEDNVVGNQGEIKWCKVWIEGKKIKWDTTEKGKFVFGIY